MIKSRTSLFIALSPLLFAFAIFSFNLLFFCFHIHALQTSFFSAIAVVVGLGIWIKKYYHIPYQSFFIPIILGILTALIIANYFFDGSFDGQWYQQHAIYNIFNGWNPIWENPSPIQTPFEETRLIHHHYARAFWIIGASIYAGTGSLEGAKMLHILLMFSIGYSTYYALSFLPQIPKWTRIFISIISILNPVSLNQCLSFYNDGLNSSLYLILAALAFAYIKRQLSGESTYWEMLGMIISIILVLNLKLIGILVIGSIWAIVFITLWLYQQKKALLPFTLIVGISCSAAICIWGFQPYIKNTLQYKHPLYPINKPEYYQSYIINQTPAFLRNEGRIKILWYSIFLRPSSVMYQKIVQRTIPFGLDEESGLLFYNGSAPLITGWGLWFGETLILATFLLIICFFIRPKFALAFLGINLLWIAICLTMEYPSWARYLSHLFLFVILPPILGLSIQNKWLKGLSYIQLLIILGNSLILGYLYIDFNLGYSQKLRKELNSLAHSNKRVVLLENFPGIASYTARLKKYDVSYRIVSHLSEPCQNKPFIGSAYDEGFVCLEDK